MSAMLDWDLWQPLFVSLGLGTAFIVAAALLAQRWTPSVAWRRTIWQVAFISIGVLALAEGSGAGRMASGWFPQQGEQEGEGQRLSEAKVIGEPDPRMLLAQGSQQSSAPAPRPLTDSSTTHVPLRWPATLWLLGFAAVTGWMVMARLAFIFLVQRRSVRDANLLVRIKSVMQRLGLRRPVRVSENSRIAGPIAYGIVLPEVSLPEGFSRRFTVEQQDVMLAHELAHLAARDPFWHALADVVTAMLWWHPLVWLAKREFRAASEAAADEASLVVENGPNLLAECLVELGGRLTRARSPGWLGMEGGDFRSGLGRRVKRLVSLTGQAWNPMGRSRVWVTRIAFTLLLVALALAATALARPLPDETGSLRMAFQRSVLGLALAAALPQAPADTAVGDREKAMALMLEGKLFQEAGQRAEAKEKFEEALKHDPGSTAARYYLYLLEQPVEPPRAETSAGRRSINRRLDSLRLQEVSFPDVPLTVVADKLATMIRAADPEGKGINFIVNGAIDSGQVDPATGQSQMDPTNVVVRLMPPLRDVTARQAIEAIVRTAGAPLRYSVEDYAVVFSPGSAPQALHTRWFKIDPIKFGRAVGESATTNMDQAIKEAISAPPVLVDTTGKVYRTSVRSSSDVNDEARRYFTKWGVDFTLPGKGIAFNDRIGQLMVRATLRDLEIIEQAIHVLSASPPQVTIEVKFAEITESDSKALGLDWFLQNKLARNSSLDSHIQLSNSSTATPGAGTSASANDLLKLFHNLRDAFSVDGANAQGNELLTGILTDAQYRVVIRALEQRQGVNVLSAPKVTTLSSRQAQIKTVNMRYIVTDLDLSQVASNAQTGVPSEVPPKLITELFELGPVLDVVPYVQTDGKTIQMTVIPTVTEFLGYDTENARLVPPEAKSPDMQQLTPLPIFRKRQSVSSVTISDGQTVVLAGGSDVLVANPKTGQPLSKGTKPPQEPKKTRLLVFVTATLIDPAGNRLNP